MPTNQYGQTYSGNDDFRGYLAANNPGLLTVTGNDGGVDTAKATATLGSFGPYTNIDAVTGAARDTYNQWAGGRTDNSAIGGYSGTASGGSSGGSAADTTATRLQIDQGINQYNDALGRTDRQQQTALGNNSNDYNSAYNRLTGSQATADQHFETSKNNQTQDLVDARGQISTNTRGLLLSGRRLLGSQGAGGGSADRYAIPTAATNEGSNQNAKVQQINGRNIAALVSGHEEDKRNFDNSFKDLGTQKEKADRGVQSQFEQQRADILNSIATLTGQKAILNGANYQTALAQTRAYTDRVKGILDHIDGLAANPSTIRENAVTLANPNMADYTFDRFTAPVANAAAPQDPTLSPAALALLGVTDEQKKQVQA